MTALTRLPVTPATDGPTSETLALAQTTSNISDSSEGCGCSESTTFSLETLQAQSQNTDNCECPGFFNRSDKEVVNYETRSNWTAGNYDCLCSEPNGFTVLEDPIVDEYSDYIGSSAFGGEASNDNNNQNSTFEENLCSCPTQEEWTHEQLALIRETSEFSGGSTDCLCVPSSEFSLELHSKLQSLTTTK
jgi:hypothetical protein